MPDANPTKFTVIEPDELLTAIVIPKPAPGTRSAYQKYGEKESFDWAIADAGVVLEMDGDVCRRAVITMGAASPVVRRSAQAEAALAGKPITEETARAAGKVAVEGAQPLSDATPTNSTSSRSRSIAPFCSPPDREIAIPARQDNGGPP